MEESLSKSLMEEGCLLSIMGTRYTLSEAELKTYSPLSYAYIGDVVYELLIRTAIVTRGNTKPGKYHQRTISYVNAATQAQLMKIIEDTLTPEENKVYHRGLNARPASTAKNQSRHDYRIATAFETLIGYLYLSGQTKRLIWLIEYGLEKYISDLD